MYKILMAAGEGFQEQKRKMEDAGLQVRQKKLVYSGDMEFIREVSGYDCVIIGGGPWNETVLNHLKNLKMIAKFGVGVDNIDLAAATKNKIAVTNAPGSNARAVAEHALASMFTLIRKISLFDRDMKSGFWENTKSDTVIGKTIGLLGFGNISKELAKFLQGLPVDIIAYDIFRDEEVAAEFGVKFVELNDFIAKSDIISIHVPLMDSTRGMVDKAFLNKMKSDSYIINTARGAIINECDLIEALKNGTIRGAALDTFETEPLPGDSELLQLDNVVLTPHTASNTDEAYVSIMNSCVDNVISFFVERNPKNVLNPDYIK